MGTTRGGGRIDQRLEGLGTQILRYGLVMVVLWIGLFKFTDVEAQKTFCCWGRPFPPLGRRWVRPSRAPEW